VHSPLLPWNPSKPTLHYTTSPPFPHWQAAPAPKKNLPARLRSIVDVFTAGLYNNICRSLFEKDKLLFALLMTLRILESEGLVPDAGEEEDESG
jgi:hypothetical protein